MKHAESQKHYLPAFGWHFLLPLYDPFTKLFGADKLRAALVEQAELRAGHRVLDVGCGTGSLLALCKRRHPDVDVTGLDPDPRGLARARRKAARAGVAMRFDQGYADALPYADGSFDRVLSSLMFHHLEPPDKAKALAEIARVLQPGGRFELADFVGPHDVGHSALRRWLHNHPRFENNAEDHVLTLMFDAGLSQPRIVSRSQLLVGSVAFYQALRPH
jgi:ubiquinone/menaquinone biosynthesis C-methylase UbiE